MIESSYFSNWFFFQRSINWLVERLWDRKISTFINELDELTNDKIQEALRMYHNVKYKALGPDIGSFFLHRVRINFELNNQICTRFLLDISHYDVRSEISNLYLQ